MTSKEIFIEAVRARADLPARLREHADGVTALEESSFDASCIEFLNTQISLRPRGPEWTALLVRRRAALLPFCDKALLRGNVRIGAVEYWATIDLATREAIHWEEFEREAAD